LDKIGDFVRTKNDILDKISCCARADGAAETAQHRRRTRARLTYADETDEVLTPGGGYFVLQLHDELIYEVNATHVSVVADIIKRSMESTTQLSVTLPVKLKAGPAWGTLTDLDL